ncbi:MAG: GPR endopeptidase [Clostridia bacterium]|nr:GPR endopeptidase [Oscillospiraceae bacterium]MBQ6796606.1 GPR endopeptidase [Clostridia bacterium]
MELRTDLALEVREVKGDIGGVLWEEERQGDITVSRMDVTTPAGARSLGKPMGKYVTVELPALTDNAFRTDERFEAVSGELSRLVPDDGEILVIGLGNRAITPDALGPKTAAKIVATRHIAGELKRSAGFDCLRPCSVLAPGVLGQTGIEVLELLRAICKSISPAAVIVIDALASRKLSRLGRTVQLSDAGISPGAGVGNNRPEISTKTLGVPVISVGVPTVVEASVLARDLMGHDEQTRENGEPMIVTPREIDLLIDRASRLLALSINSVLHPKIDPIDLLSVT